MGVAGDRAVRTAGGFGSSRRRSVRAPAGGVASGDVPAGEWLEIDGSRKVWVRDEPGPPGAPAVLLLHGLGATGALNWPGAHVRLRDRFRVVIVDHRGHGRGGRTDAFRLEDCADDAAGVAEALGLDRPIVAGYSMGGPIASLVWRRHPGVVGGLVLCATSRNFAGRPAEKLGFAALAFAGSSPLVPPASVAQACGRAAERLRLGGPLSELCATVQEMAGHDPRSILQAAVATGGFDSSGWIGEVDVPTAVIVTTRDLVVPTARQFRLARSIPAATVHKVPSGHLGAGGKPRNARFLAALREACVEVAGRRQRLRPATTAAGSSFAG